MPSLTDAAFLLPLILLFTKFSGTQLLFSDGDTGWHIRTGEWILRNGRVPTEDLFSYTKPHAPWFAWEWAWDVLFAYIHKAWGLPGVGFATVIALGLVSVLLYRLVVRTCDNQLAAFGVTIVAMFGSSIHWLARPHLFSWIFFLLFLHILRDAEEGNTRVLRWLPLLMVIWTNTHGAFFTGILLTLTTAVGEAIQAFWSAGNSRDLRSSAIAAWKKAAPFLGCAGACLCATFVNPYTWRLHLHIFEYLGNADLMNSVQEFQTLSFHHPAAIFFEGFLLSGIAAAIWLLRLGRVTPAISVLGWAHLALFAGRNIPFFLMIAAPPIALLASHALRCSALSPATPQGLRGFFVTVNEISGEFKAFERVARVHLVSALGVLSLAALFASGAKGFEGQFNPELFPHQAIPVIEASSARRIFTSDQWGDYLLYRLYPSRQVFMDGRSDFYGSSFATTYLHILEARFDWRQQLSRFSVDMVTIKADTPLSTVLKTAPGWKLLFDDAKVLVFQRNLGDANDGR